MKLPPDWKLTLDEGFDGAGLDSALWSIGEPWDRTPGSKAGPDAWMPLPSPAGLVEVSAGTLKLRARPSSKAGYKVDTAFITSRGKYAFTHGYIEAKVLLPTSAGLWSSFWLLGNGTGPDGWPKCGEIDIFEVLEGVSPGVPFRTDHWADSAGGHVQHTIGDVPGQAYPAAVPGYGSRWVTFGLHRTPARLTTYIDGEPRYVTNRADYLAAGVLFDAPMHVRLELNAGAWDQKAKAVAPGVLEVDYVRAWTI